MLKNEKKASNSAILKSLNIAIKAHADQTDRSGDPVILHPLAVGGMGHTPDVICAGYLHDVVEDTDLTFDDLLSMGVSEEVVCALKLLTHDKSVPYLDYVQNIIKSQNNTAIQTKLNDLRHNITRGKRMGYTHLVEKHTSAYNLFVRAGITEYDPRYAI